MWQSALELGIPEIDAQHKQLVDMVGRVRALILDAEDGIDCYDEIDGVLQELEAYTEFHFRDEEVFMFKKGYLGLEEHKVLHDRFIEKVHETLASDFDCRQLEVLNEVADFLMNWVVDHIVTEDRGYLVVLEN